MTINHDIFTHIFMSYGLIPMSNIAIVYSKMYTCVVLMSQCKTLIEIFDYKHF